MCGAGVWNHKGGSRESWKLLVKHAKQDVNLHDFLHRNYMPTIDQPCMLNPRPYVNPDALNPKTLRPKALKQW